MLATQFYSLQAWVPGRSDGALRRLIESGLEAAAGIRVHRELRQAQVLVLAGMPGKLLATGKNFVTAGSEPGKISISSGTAEDLRDHLEHVLNRPVLLDDPPPGRFTLELRWDPANPAEIESLLRDKFGLEFKPEMRSIEFLVVDALDAQAKTASN